MPKVKTATEKVHIEERRPDGSTVKSVIEKPVTPKELLERRKAVAAEAKAAKEPTAKGIAKVLNAGLAKTVEKLSTPTGPKPAMVPTVSGKPALEPDLSGVHIDWLLAEIVRRGAMPPLTIPLVRYEEEIIKVPVEVKVLVDGEGKELPVQPVAKPKQLVPGTKPTAPAKSTSPTSGKARVELFGHAVTAVIRGLGKLGWDYAKTKAGLTKMGIEMADATIRIQLRAGTTGERGEPAVLSKAQLAQMS